MFLLLLFLHCVTESYLSRPVNALLLQVSEFSISKEHDTQQPIQFY